MPKEPNARPIKNICNTTITLINKELIYIAL